MKPHRLYIIMCIFSLLSFAGCRDEEPVQSAESKRTITVNLGIAMSRATDIEGVIGDNTRPDNLRLWIFDGNAENATLIFHENITNNLDFSITDLNNRLVQTIERIINVENEINTLHFYIVMNTTGISLDENSTPHDIETATFTQQIAWTGDNKVPLYGYGTLDVSTHRSEYSVSIEATRAVGKLELFFTKENENAYLKINKIELEQMPDIGYLKNAGEGETQQVAESYTDEIDNLLDDESGNGLEIETSLPESEDTQIGHFSDYEDKFTKLKLTHTYLLENLNGDTWTAIDNNKDYIYPTIIEDEETRYKMTVFYQTSTNGTEKEQVVYLPAIERNVWNKIFARVKGGTLQIQYKAMPWETVVTSIGYAPQPVFPDEEGKTVFDSDDRYESEDYYVLLPKKEYDGKDTRSLMDELYTEAKSGDPEAVLCYVCRPGYVDNSKVANLTYLKDGSGGARFYFMLTGPEGATWEAHLNDPEGNFAFSTTFEDSEFEDNADGYPVGVYKVTHGIARLKPYVIQIIATHNYTGTTDNPKQEGTESEVKYPEIKTPAGNQEWGDKNYFGNNYLTTWGEKQWKEKNVISAEFYITVKLTDGTEYELDINPSYNGYNQKAFSDEGFYYKDNRRYAGTDTRIWIRQLRAQYNGEHGIENYVDMAKHVDERSEDEWWRVNPYWNTDNE